MHTCIHERMNTCIHACMHIYIHTYIHTCMHTRVRTYVHVHTYMHNMSCLCMHLSIYPCNALHVYISLYIYIYILFFLSCAGKCVCDACACSSIDCTAGTNGAFRRPSAPRLIGSAGSTRSSSLHLPNFRDDNDHVNAIALMRSTFITSSTAATMQLRMPACMHG